MTPTGWGELGKCLAEVLGGSATSEISLKLLEVLLETQKQEVSLLQDIQKKLDTLLNADREAANLCLKRFKLLEKNRSDDHQRADIEDAKRLFTRAISQAPNDLQKALVHRDIAVCFVYLKDYEAAFLHLNYANEIAEEWLKALNSGETEYTKQHDSYMNVGAGMFAAGAFAPVYALGFLINPVAGILGIGAYFYGMKKCGDYAEECKEQLKKLIAITQDFQVEICVKALQMQKKANGDSRL